MQPGEADAKYIQASMGIVALGDDLREAEFRTINTLCALTFGMGREWVSVPVPTIGELSGQSYPNVGRCLRRLAEMGLIDRTPPIGRKAGRYAIRVDRLQEIATERFAALFPPEPKPVRKRARHLVVPA